jgi:ribonuclease HI
LDGKSAHGGTGTLLAQAKRLIEGREVTWEWVPAHAGHALNEGADRLALAARRAGENKTDRQLLRTISTDIAKEMSKAHREGRSVEPTMRPVARTNKV